MRILHTSDWHLGQHFIGKSRLAEHQSFIEWLLGEIQSNQIDALIISGDVYDTGSPPSYARELYNQLVIEVNKLGCQLVVLGGNHDSVSTLNESKGLLKHLNAEVVASVESELEQQIITLNNRSGEPAAILCAIPYIRPRDVMQSAADQSAKEKANSLGTAIAEHYQAIYDLAVQKRNELGLSMPIIATGHLTAMGVKTSESVRDIYVGNLEAFPASAFPPADYIALGHIHRPQIVSKSEHIRYCGSPIPLSFDEIGTQKQVLLVEFEQSHLKEITPLLVPTFQPMASIKGDLDSIKAQLYELEAQQYELPVWLSIEVQTQDYLNDLTQRIEQLTLDLNVEVLQLRRARKQIQRGLTGKGNETLSELNAYEVFTRRLNDEAFESEAEQNRIRRLKDRFCEIVTTVESENDLPASKPADEFFSSIQGSPAKDCLEQEQEQEQEERLESEDSEVPTAHTEVESNSVDESEELGQEEKKGHDTLNLFSLECDSVDDTTPSPAENKRVKGKTEKAEPAKRPNEAKIDQDDLFSALVSDAAEEKSL
ncbi:exonuclease subunit SbcD [Neptuniibacter sp. SY11_33]|uniref:exonuclease subunit SbcD n=1 Tax=Neptuniibacter sp. SY11_33 TaxID=3398215 RepID=UPI0039F4E1AE